MRKPYTILVADDEPKIVEVLSGYLDKEGYQVVTASTGPEGHRILEKWENRKSKENKLENRNRRE